MARLLVVSRSMALAMRLADVHEVIEHPVEAIDQLPSPALVDVVVLDVGEPTTAIHALDQVRAGGDATPVLIVSGYQPAWASLVSVDIPGVMVVPLPITRAALLDGVAELARSRPDRSSSRRDEYETGERADPTGYVDSPARPSPAVDEPSDWPVGWQGPPEWLLGVRDEPAPPAPSARYEPQHARRTHPPEPRSPEQSPTGIAVVRHPAGPETDDDPADADRTDPPSAVQTPSGTTGFEPEPAAPDDEDHDVGLRHHDGEDPDRQDPDPVAADGSDDVDGTVPDAATRSDDMDGSDDADGTDVVEALSAGWDELITPGRPEASSPTPSRNPPWLRRTGPRPAMLHARDGGQRSDDVAEAYADAVQDPAPERNHWSMEEPALDPPDDVDDVAMDQVVVDEVAAPVDSTGDAGDAEGDDSEVDDVAIDDSADAELDDSEIDDPAIDDPEIDDAAIDDQDVSGDGESGPGQVGAQVSDSAGAMGHELWWEGPQPPPLPPVERPEPSEPPKPPPLPPMPQAAAPARVPEQTTPEPPTAEQRTPEPPPEPSIPEPSLPESSSPEQAQSELPRLLLPPPPLESSPPLPSSPPLQASRSAGDEVGDPLAPAAPALGASDTRSLILPYPVEGVRLGRPNGWAGQEFDWWHTDRGVSAEPDAAEEFTPDPNPVQPFSAEAVTPDPVIPEPVLVDPVLVDPVLVEPVLLEPIRVEPAPTRFTPPEPVDEESVEIDDPDVDVATSPTEPDDDVPDRPEPAPPPEPLAEPLTERSAEPLTERSSEPAHLRPAAAALARRRELLGLPERPTGPSELDQRLAGVPFQTSFGPGGTSAELVALGLRHDGAGLASGEAAVLDRPTERPERSERPIVTSRPVEPPAMVPGRDGRFPAAGTDAGHARHGGDIGSHDHLAEPDPPRLLDTADLVEAMSERVGELFGVSDTAQMLAAEIVEIADADAAAVLVPDGGLWRVSGGVGLRPPERRLVLDAGHWLVSEIAVGGRALLVEDTDIVRPKLAGAPLAAWRHLLAIPIPEVRSAVVLARGYEAGAFGEQDLAAVVEPVRRSVSLMRTALQTRQLARLLTPLRETESSH